MYAACFAHLPCQVHFHFEPVGLTDSENSQIYSKMKTGNWWWNRQNTLPAGATIVPVICAFARTHLTNCSGEQHAWLLYLMIGNTRKDIHPTPEMHPCFLGLLIPCSRKGAKNTDEAWHSAVGTVLSPLRNLDITVSSLKWNCAE
jgi:hypothetical protein